MHKKSLKGNHSFQELQSKLKRYVPIIRNGWLIKFSHIPDIGVLLCIISLHTHQVIMRHMKEEAEAVAFIHLVESHNSREEWIDIN